MHKSYHPRHALRSLSRALVPAVLLALAVGSTGPASGASAASAASARAKGVTTYTVIPTPKDITLCPGETKQVAVRVSGATARGAVVGQPSDVRRAKISASSLAPSIANVDPASAQTARLQLRSGSRSLNFGAWFKVQGQKPGDTAITFRAASLLNPSVSVPAAGGEDLASLGSSPLEQVTVHVKCQFKVSLSAAWTVPGQEVTHDASFYLPDVGLAPDADGKFQVDASVPNRTVRYGGACGGVATVSSSKAHFNGSVSPSGLLHMDVTFDPVPHTSGEGCLGKSQSASATLQPLVIDVDVSSGAHHYFLQLPQVLYDDAGNLQGNTLAYVTVLP